MEIKVDPSSRLPVLFLCEGVEAGGGGGLRLSPFFPMPANSAIFERLPKPRMKLACEEARTSNGMSPLKCIRYVHLDTVDLLETLPPRQRRKYRRHWRERNWAARNDDSSTTVGRGSFSCSNIIPSSPNIPNISGLRQTTQTGCCAVFSPPTCTKSGGKKNCQLPNLDFPPTSIGGTPATYWLQLQPHHLPHQHTTCHSFSCRRVLPPPFPQAPFFRVSRHGSCHDFHSCSSFLEQLQHLDRRPEQIRQDLPQRRDDSE